MTYWVSTVGLQNREIVILSVVLTDPGGIGKTRLAPQTAANLLDHFVNGVYLVSLASIRDPDLVIAVIAQTLGARAKQVGSLCKRVCKPISAIAGPPAGRVWGGAKSKAMPGSTKSSVRKPWLAQADCNAWKK